MAKVKYTPTEVKQILSLVLANGLYHMQSVEQAILKLDLKNDETDSEENKQQARVFTLILTILNDLIHPAHEICVDLLGDKIKDTIERYVKNQKLAFDNKLIDPCSCVICTKQKSQAQ